AAGCFGLGLAGTQEPVHQFDGGVVGDGVGFAERLGDDRDGVPVGGEVVLVDRGGAVRVGRLGVVGQPRLDDPAEPVVDRVGGALVGVGDFGGGAAGRVVL